MFDKKKNKYSHVFIWKNKSINFLQLRIFINIYHQISAHHPEIRYYSCYIRFYRNTCCNGALKWMNETNNTIC